MDYVVALLLPLVLIAFTLRILWKLIIPKDTAAEFFGTLMRDAFIGVWHVIFGPPKVRVVRPRRRLRRR